MDYLTVEMVQKLKSVGFSFCGVYKNCSETVPLASDPEHDCCVGRVFHYDGCDYILGGRNDDSPGAFSEFDLKVAREGIWLPRQRNLFDWLRWNTDCNVTVEFLNETGYFYGKATLPDGREFSGSGPDLICCLYKMILKICRDRLQK